MAILGPPEAAKERPPEVTEERHPEAAKDYLMSDINCTDIV